MAAPFFFVKKKDGKLRPVQDYRALNDMTIKNRYPLPLISELTNKLKGAKYFTALDVRWGYNNIRIKEGDEWKAAFRTNRGLFEPLVMFFGLTNAPATFQTMMNDLFRDLITRNEVVVYIDDILIYSDNLEHHHKIVREVLEILRQNNLCLKPEKCLFDRLEIPYLGVIISENRIRMDPAKVKGVTEWPVPRAKKQLQAFLGFLNFYRRFIKDFSKVAHPLHHLTGKVPWEWTTKCQDAFDGLKKLITSAPVLHMATDEDPFKVEADSSDFATGAVLSQKQGDIWYPIAFLSKSLSEVERNYDIHDKELLAIIRALDEWRHFLEGAQYEVEIYTDHQRLIYFQTAQKLNRRQARWALFLSRFNYKLHHRAGKTMGKPDALSRRSDHDQGLNDNEDRTLLPPTLFINTTTAIENIEHIQKQCEKFMAVTEETVLQYEKDKKVERRNNLLWYQEHLYIPPNRPLRTSVIRTHHSTSLTGHPGVAKTIELLKRNYWWTTLRCDVKAFVSSCPDCQRTKNFPAKPVGLLQPNEVPSQPWEVISVDLISGLPASNGYDAILVVVDRFSKMIHTLPTHTGVTAEGVANLYRDNIWKL
ncbi:MAG TPA: reverse transcriptase domain-containing protein, partial [Chlamydiales bacterium]|nr:reverse transcriptase domain-containing protein [Chlamydiales bacterium]